MSRSKSEAEVIRDAHPHLKPLFYRRIENAAGEGEPDVFFCIDGISGWFEAKYARQYPVGLNTPVFASIHGLLTSQENWLYSYTRQRGLGWIFARIADFYVLVPGTLALDFNKMPLHAFDKYRIQLDMMRYHLIHPQSLGWQL